MDINSPRLATARRAVFFFATLTGCTVGPNYKPPQIHVNPAYGETDTPATTHPSRTVSRSMPLVEWWTTFNDTELDSLIERAAQSNLDLRRAGARVLEARAQRAITIGGTYPNLDFTGSATKNRLSKNGIPIPTGASGGSAGAASGGLGTASPALARPETASSSQGGGISSLLSKSELDLYQLGFDASWELDLFGGLRRGVQAASADLAASVEDRRDAMVILFAEVARDYIDLRGVQRRQALAEENLRSQRQTLDLIRSKHRAGFTTDLDVARQAALVATTASEIPPLVNQQKEDIHSLGVLLGEDPMALMTELSKPKPIPKVPKEVPIGLPAELLRRRPDIRRAERQLAAATARVGVATANLYPRLSLSGSFAFQSTKPATLLDYGSRTFSIGPAIDWPIFNAGRLKANVQASNAREQQAMAAYQQTVLSALRDVENALSAYSTEQLRHQALEDAVKANVVAVDLANKQWKNGVTDFLTVLDAQRNLFAAEDQLAQSDRNISTNLVAIYKALGGGWEINR